MARSFAITTAALDPLHADAQGHAEAVFTVTNATSRPIRGLAKAKALGDTEREWLDIEGESERDFAAGATQQITVTFDARPAPSASTANTGARTGAATASSIKPGKYSFRLDVASAMRPEEDFTEGPVVTVEVAAVAQPVTKAFPIWIIPVIAVVLIAIGITLWLLLRTRKVEVPVATSPTPESRVEVPVTPVPVPQSAPSPTPESCQDIHKVNPNAPDGDYLIFPIISGGQHGKVTLFCKDMATAPKEYLTLVNTGGPSSDPFGPKDSIKGFNYSTAESSDKNHACPVTVWYKVRLDLKTLQVITDDYTFTKSTSTCNAPVFDVPYGVAAGGCVGSYVAAYANINLVGTPFKVSDKFTLDGIEKQTGWANPPDAPNKDGYGADYVRLVDSQNVDLGVGGCGHIGPNKRQRLQLAYIGS